MEIILASGSPRRKELLGLICPVFRVEVSGADEHVTETLSPEQLVARLAEKKASEVASRFPEAAVIGSDTVVELDAQPSQALMDKLAALDTTYRVRLILP